MRTITDHVVAGDAAPQLTITVLDEPGAGGANHAYKISWRRPDDKRGLPDGILECFVSFQCGPIQEHGVNGITQEALLAIVIDRLHSFQAGPFACNENAEALSSCQSAMAWLQQRTRSRIARGVEGRTEK